MENDDFARGTGYIATPSPEPQNRRTMVRLEDGVFEREPVSGQIALTRYESALRAAVQEHAADRVFVALVDSDGSQSQHRILAPGESVIFGRHERARLHHSSMDLSLRHVAIAVAPSSTAVSPLVRLWDLATTHPFRTEDGIETEALSANGAVFATVGSVHLAIIPLGSLPSSLPLGTRALWNAFPERTVTSRIAGGSVVRAVPDVQGNFSARATLITRTSSATAPEDCEADLAVAELSLTTEGTRRKFRISMEALERGILIGRYERCINLTGEFPKLSRVHLLISKIGNDVIAIDTASTVGSTRGMGEQFQTAILADKDKILMAEIMLVEWKYDRLAIV